jgi:tetratricopeptide (TPR) repeat protein
MRRHIPPALAVVAAAVVGLGATSCSLLSSDASSQVAQAGPSDPGKGGSVGPLAGDTVTAPTRNANATGNAARVAAMLQAGIQQARQQDWAGAATSFRVVLSIDPKNVYALYDLGVIAETSNDGAHAIAYYDKALSANGKYAPAMYNKAILLEASRPTQAIALYNQIIAISPQASTAYLRMAFVEAELGDQAQARVADAKAVGIDPSLGKYRLPVKKNLGPRCCPYAGLGRRTGRGRLGRGCPRGRGLRRRRLGRRRLRRRGLGGRRLGRRRLRRRRLGGRRLRRRRL